MKSIMEYLRNTVFNIHFERRPEDIQTSFQKELNYQCNKIVLFASIVTIFAWVSYIPTDSKLYPDEPLLIVLRIGLSVTGLTMFILRFFDKSKKRSLLMLNILGAYLVIATGILTGLTKGDSVYVGGYLFILTLLAVVPIRRRAAWAILFTSVGSFFTIGFLKGMEFNTIASRYVLNDIIATTIIAAIFIFLLDMIRFRSWTKSKKIEQQNEELAADKKKIDKLLLNILPPSVADELKESGHVKPVYYKSATIVFTDFVNFTNIVENLSPDILVNELDESFSYFDSLMDKFNLEKLKTIGDSYMYAGGVPIENNTHEIDAVLAALKIQKYINKTKKLKENTGRPYFELRIGVNTGPLMAGVVGDKKFVYDVWGDSVNLASRLETSGLPGRVNISGSTFSRVKNFFDIESRGQIIAKSKGKIDMYFIKGIKPELSKNGAGLIPTDKFLEMYRIRKAEVK